MTEASKQNQGKHKAPAKKGTGKGKLILLLIAIIILGTYLLMDIKPKWLQEIFKHTHDKTATSQQIIKSQNTDSDFSTTKSQTSIKADETKECLLPESLPTTTDEIVNFAPKETTDKFPADDSNALNPYEASDEKQTQETEAAIENLANNLNDYRIFLANINEMMIKFSRDIDYSDNLAIITQIDFPPKIKEIIAMLEAYNKMIEDEKTKSEQVLPFNTNIFEKFLKITKGSASQDEMKELKIKIDERIDLLNDYVFSSDLQEMFLK